MHIHTSNQEELELGFGDYTCNWGLHICGLYETENERDEILFGFLHQGAVVRDKQLYCPVEWSKEGFIKEYARRYPEDARHTQDPDLFTISSAKEFYYPDGTFSPLAMDKRHVDYYEESQKNGRRNVRGTAEMAWAVEAIHGVENLMLYESRLNYFIPGKPWISICLYNTTKFSGSIIMKVLQTHPYTISGGTITQNPYYRDPDIWLRENAPEFLNNQERV